MSELDKVLDALMKDKKELIIQEAPSEDRDEFLSLFRENKKKKIIEEIKEECKQTLIQEADIESMICLIAYLYSFWKNAVTLFDDLKKQKPK